MIARCRSHKFADDFEQPMGFEVCFVDVVRVSYALEHSQPLILKFA